MSSSQEYLDFILDQLADLKDLTHRAMMGDYMLFYKGKVIGGIYGAHFLIKPTISAFAMMPNASWILPYNESQEMLLVDNIEDKEFLQKLVKAIYDDLPDYK